MKKGTRKGFLMGIVVTLLIVALSATVFAAGAQKTIAVLMGGITIILDGQKLEPKDANGNPVDALIYNGTTYLPVRAVGAAFNKAVDWDGKTSTVYLGIKPGSTNYSRTNPAPIGTAQKITVKNRTSDYTASIAVTDIYRGAEAWTKILAENQFNDHAPAGKEYILAKVKADATAINNDKSIGFSYYDFVAFNSTNTEYARQSIAIPTPSFSGQVYAGGSLEGYIVFTVDINDTAPKVVYGANYDGSGGIWFKLYK